MTLSLPTTPSIEPRALRLPRGRRLEVGQATPRIMGIVNLTPDSFSDGGLWTDPGKAVDHALSLLLQGADLLDLGAESTRPGGGVYGSGAAEVSAAEELDRLLPVLEPLRQATDAPISVDTKKAVVAEAALETGADLINDISAIGEPDLARAVAAAGCPIVLMHSRGELASMQKGIAFHNVVDEVASELEEAVERAIALGVDRSQIIVDPGIGFGKTTQQNVALLRQIPALRALGPVLVGASRKSFIGGITGAEVDRRLPGSLASVAWAASGGASFVRVHDVEETAHFLAVWRGIATGEVDQ